MAIAERVRSVLLGPVGCVHRLSPKRARASPGSSSPRCTRPAWPPCSWAWLGPTWRTGSRRCRRAAPRTSARGRSPPPPGPPTSSAGWNKKGAHHFCELGPCAPWQELWMHLQPLPSLGWPSSSSSSSGALGGARGTCCAGPAPPASPGTGLRCIVGAFRAARLLERCRMWALALVHSFSSPPPYHIVQTAPESGSNTPRTRKGAKQAPGSPCAACSTAESSARASASVAAMFMFSAAAALA